jgi:hypothetical protein
MHSKKNEVHCTYVLLVLRFDSVVAVGAMMDDRESWRNYKTFMVNKKSVKLSCRYDMYI